MLNSYDSSEIFKELTTDLRSEVVCYVERANVNKIPFLRNKSTKFRADLILMMEPSSVAKGEKIVKRGDKADLMYFIVKGRAAVMTDKGARIKSFVEGSYFGEVGCLMGGTRTADVEAVSDCQLLVLTKKNC